MTVSERPAGVPDHYRTETWRQCLTEGCSLRVDPWDHNARCDQHRPRTEIAKRRDVAERYAEKQLMDPDYGRRLLEAIIELAPAIVAVAMRAIDPPEW